jgi:hypothetical protein
MSDQDDAARRRARIAAWKRHEYGPLAAKLRDLIQKIGPRAMRPSENDLLGLAELIDDLRWRCKSARDGALPERAKLQKALLAVLEVIDPVIAGALDEEQPKFVRIRDAILALRPEPSDLPSIVIEGAPIINVETVILPRTPESEHGPQWQQWHDYAVLLVKEFARLTQVSLHDNDGAAAKFMEWVIPTISGESPPGSTVMAYVGRALGFIKSAGREKHH